MIETEQIAAAAAGLHYISETDSAFELKQLKQDEPIESQLLLLLQRNSNTTIQKQDLEYFLRNHTRTFESATPADETRAQAFRKLQSVLQQHLTGIVAYRLGEINIDAAITGTTKSGERVALLTKLVET